MSAKIRALRAKKTEVAKAARAVLDTAAAADGRGLTAEEQTTFDKYMAEADSIEASIEREERLVLLEAGLNKGGSVEVGAAKDIKVENNNAKDAKRGFKTVGHFAQALVAAAQNQKIGRAIDERLEPEAAAPATFGNEATGADGGFLVPPEFAKDVFTLSLGDDSLIPLTDNTETQGNSMVWPTDETTPWGTDGIRAQWSSEAQAATPTKMKLGQAALRMDKLIGLVPVSDELSMDASALGSYLTKKLGDTVRWKSNEAVLTGTAVGQLMGIMNSPAILEIAKESGQGNGTLKVDNIAKMIAALPPGSFGKSIWLMNNDVLPAVITMTLGNYPIYMPPNPGIQASPYGSLMGRPIMLTQHAETFAAAGDIQLHDFSYYRTLTKAGGMQVATSMHLYFDADAMAFRITYRLGGEPKLKAPISPAKGTNKMSPFIRLGAR